jgi:peptidylprolyl isomerase
MAAARVPARAAAIALACALAACSSGDVIASIETTTFAPSLGVNLAASTHTATGLYYRDISVGAGAAVQTGHTLAMHYTGALPDGTVFDANLAPATPLSFTLGAHTVIAGWDEGIVGMHVGGTRQLIIPPALGYGASAQGSIPPNSILVFSVTVVSTN